MPEENYRITVGGYKKEITLEVDPHSFYTILKEFPEDDLLGHDVKIASKNGKKKFKGRIVTGTIYINDRATHGQIVYVDNFPKNVLGWKQLCDLGLMQASAESCFVVDVPPVRIEGDTDPGCFQERYLYRDLIGDARRVIASWVRDGLIEHSDSVCNAPISLGMKTNGKVKINFYFGDLNECSPKEPPHPKLNNQRAIEAIILGKYYSVFKLFYAEWQIPLDTYTKYKTAFIFMGKRYVWNRLPGKYQNTASRVSDALEKVLDKLPQNVKKRVTYYSDTFLVSAETKEECDRFTINLQHHLMDNSFQIHDTQSQTTARKVQFLGREVTEDGVTMDKDVLQKVRDITPPNHVHDLKTILGLLNFAYHYTPGFGIFSHRLNKLTSNNHEFYWDDNAQAALNRLQAEVLRKRIVVPGLAEKEACTVQIFVNGKAWMAQILNSAGKPYRYASDIFPPVKMEDTFANRELKAMKEVWGKNQHALENRDVEWEVESPEIKGYKDDPDSVPRAKSRNLDFLTSQGCKIKVVPPGGRKPAIPWNKIPKSLYIP